MTEVIVGTNKGNLTHESKSEDPIVALQEALAAVAGADPAEEPVEGQPAPVPLKLDRIVISFR